MNILCVIDPQKDFIDGSLGSAHARETASKLTDFIMRSNSEFDEVVCTYDSHGDDYLDTLEGEFLPIPHCIEGTDGIIYDSQVDDALVKYYPNAHYFEKHTFGSMDMANFVKGYINFSFDVEPDVILVVGFCTDICVLANAMLLRTLLPNTRILVYADLCAGSTEEKHEAALKVMESCQIEVIR